MKILDRYLITEMLGPFFIGIFGFILVLTVDLLFTMADLIINKGVPLWEMIRLLVYKLPSLLVMTFPVSTIFGSTMSLGRLSQDNEIIALRTSGLSIFRIATPLLIVGALVSFLSFFINEAVVPHANFVSNKIIQQIIYRQPLPEVKENVFFKDAKNRYYFARRVNLKEHSMENIVVSEVTDEKFPRFILAESAAFSGNLWSLKNGVIHRYDNQGYLNYEANFSEMKLNVSQDAINFGEQKTPADMDRKELQDMINIVGKGGSTTYALKTELFMKYSIPLTCFVFALVGIPFSLASPRAGRTWGMIVTIVFMFTFYVFASIFRSLGKGGIIDPLVAAFTPQISFVIISTILLYWEGRFN